MKTCKYYKKRQFCPYQEVGCKFAHEAENHIDTKEKKSKDGNEDEVHSEATNTKNDEYERNAEETPKQVFENDVIPADTQGGWSR